MDTSVRELPIFCDNCPTLAFAILDGAPLCEACLMEAVKNGGVMKIEPLKFREPTMFVSSHTSCLESATH